VKIGAVAVLERVKHNVGGAQVKEQKKQVMVTVKDMNDALHAMEEGIILVQAVEMDMLHVHHAPVRVA
jgi:hypothetical protein